MTRASGPRLRALLPTLPLLLLAAAPLSGQAGGEVAQRTVLDGVYTEEQAERGEGIFRQNCSSCHTPAEFTGVGFMRRWTGVSVGTLFDFVRSTMPQDFPGALTAQQYADVLAFFLSVNELPDGESELPGESSSLDSILMQPPPP